MKGMFEKKGKPHKRLRPKKGFTFKVFTGLTPVDRARGSHTIKAKG